MHYIFSASGAKENSAGLERSNKEFIVPSRTIVNPDVISVGKYNNYKNNNDGDKETNARTIVKFNNSEVVPNTNKYTLRTHTCGDIGDSHVGQKVKLMGWLEFSRMKKFILLRDGYGKVQLTIPESRIDIQDIVGNISFESVVSAEGIVGFRPPGLENRNQKAGNIEVNVTKLTVLNMAKKSLPFHIRNFNKPNEIIRMKYRYLDIRFENMQRNLRIRSKTIHKMRRFLIEHLNFVEVETPTLFKRTPGGAQEFIVPTQIKDKFYSLVQSPQQFKQLLMIGSIDRYFQIARCYRDETGSGDRQPEFTQLDIEMSFCDREGVIKLIEDLLKYCWPEDMPPLKTPFPRLSYDEAMNAYGTDKPDLRFNWEFKNLTSLFRKEENNCNGKYNINKFLTDNDFAAYAFVGRKGGAKFSGSTRKKIENEISFNYPNTKFLYLPVKSVKLMKESLELLFCSSVACEIEKISGYEPGDVLFLGIGKKNEVLESLGKIRLYFAEYLEKNDTQIFDRNAFNFVWVIDFPLFECKDGKIKSAHHPFTQPQHKDVHLLESDPLKVTGLHYDLVLNGSEIGGGSIRIKDHELQKLILEKILNLNSECLSHLLEGLASGAPPHGGIALGIDRLLAVLCGAESIRDVIAFPKTNLGNDLMAGAPSDISEKEKQLYKIT
ncbi:hypothetical protein RUM44_007520 [Polyplax serrata]|uniref:Aminoacyl-transfer RNA synthetases class-II family profile domain-containing protein n=1 Tax=Polyplax serrata TaxID=468196 RepID=A0ABR1B0W6_POLSC